jgi:ABC-type lipoprotein release transport system permease subunit
MREGDCQSVHVVSAAGRFYAWAQLRASWRRRLALVLLLAAIGTVAIGAAAGAMRTSTAVDRFVSEQRGFDALVLCGPPELEAGAYTCERKVGALDPVAKTASLIRLAGALEVEGQHIEVNDDSCFSGSGDVNLAVAPDGRFGTDINTRRFIAGGPADPRHADEIVIGRELARRVGLRVGDTIDFRLYAGPGTTPDHVPDCLSNPSEWRPPRALTVVGIEVAPFEVRPESGDYLALVYATPALLAELGDLPDDDLLVAATLRPGYDFEDLHMPPPSDDGQSEGAIPGSVNADNLKRSGRPFVIAQWLVSALSAAAGLVLVGQMLSRQLRAEAVDFRNLRQLGLTGRDLSSIGLAHVLSVIVPAAALAAVGSIVTSPFTPLGVARVIEVDRGVRVDAAVLGLGIVLMILLLACASAPAIIRTSRQRAPVAAPSTGRAGAVARQLGGGPVSTTGLRMAFEPMRGPNAPPLRTGFGMILVAVTLLVVATLFAGSLTHLLESKHLVGWNWDALLGVEGGDELDEPITADDILAAARKTPGIAAATSGTIFQPVGMFIGPERLALQTYSLAAGPIGPTMISGRPPRGTDEIVLGRETMSRLGYHEGDRVPYVALTGDWEEIQQGGGTEVPGEVTIVGTGVFLTSGGDSRLGTGSAVDFEFFRALVPEVQPDGIFIRLASGAELDEVTAAVGDALGTDQVFGVTDEIAGPQLVDIEHVRNLPIALAAMLALLAVGMVGQVIIGSTHARGAELGILRALGMRPRQIRGAIVVQAVAISTSVLIVAIPLGIAIGRQGWKAFALSLGTKPEVSVATAWLSALIVGLLVLASVLALIGSARPRRQLAAALRRE